MQVELIRYSKKYGLYIILTLETSKWIFSRPTCLRMESRSNIHLNHLFRIRFKMFAFPANTSHVFVVKIVYK